MMPREWDGIGDVNRAVDVALDWTSASLRRPRAESGVDENGTGKGFGECESSRGVLIVSV